jgi:uncharacterized protein (TIGR02996 family)
MSRPVPSPLPVEPSVRGVPGVEGILHAIAAEPGEPLHRLVLADLLEEHGRAERARFIRLQCLEERWPGAATDELRLMTGRHREAFLGGLHHRYFFAGGLLEGLEIGVSHTWIDRMFTEVRDSVDVRRVVIGPRTLSRNIDGAALAALMTGLTHLTTPFTHESDIGNLFWALDRSAHAHLTHLSFGREEVRPEALMWIARGAEFPRLTSLDLAEASIDEETLAALLTSSTQDRLTELKLSEATFLLAELHEARRLTRLEVPTCNLHHVELIELLKSEGTLRLRHLDLGDNYATDEVISWLAGAGPVELEYLNLRDNTFHADGARAIAESPRLASLRFLSLKGNKIGHQAARAIVGSPHLAGLELLDLSIADARSAAFTLAADSPLTRLHTLRLGGNDIGTGGAEDLAGSAQLAGLRSLDLHACGISEAGALALASSAYLTGLTYLDLRYNPLGERGKAAILDRWPNALT